MKRFIALLVALMLFLTSCDTIAELGLEEILANAGIIDVEEVEPEDTDPGEEDEEPEMPEEELPEENPDDEEGEGDEADIPDAEKPDEGTPDEGTPDEDAPDEGTPDEGTPDEGTPDEGTPDEGTPDEDAPDEEDGCDVVGHSYNVKVTQPTCEDDGYSTYTCTVCGYFYVEYDTPAFDHRYNAVVTAPTCLNGGYTTYTCIICYDSYVASSTAALGHNWQAATTSAPKTCKTCGLTEGEKLPEENTSGGYDDTLYVTYVNVGQGDCIFIKLGDFDMIIDAGTANYGTTVSNYLKSQKVDDIELMINTHADADHCGGLTQVLKDFVVEEVWISPLTKTTAAYKNFAAAIKSEGLTAKNPTVGTVYTYEYLTLTVLYDGSGTSNANDSSIVVMLEYGSFKFLFTGDIGSDIESKLLKNTNVDVSCDVLKVAHHGSKYSSTSAFLKATGARYGVICVGDNDYGHPTSTALNNLASAGIAVYRTDLNGHVIFSTDGATMTLPGNGGTVNPRSAISLQIPVGVYSLPASLDGVFGSVANDSGKRYFTAAKAA